MSWLSHILESQEELPRQNKALGQVFLKEEWPCTRIVENLKAHGVTHVLEIDHAVALTKHL